MLNWSSCPEVERESQRLGGCWAFRGTRVPVSAHFENLKDGVQLAQFVELFLGVTIEQARTVLEDVAKRLTVSQAI